MKFNLQGFIDVLTFQVSWMEANFFWVFISFLLYLGIAIILFILMSEKQGAKQRKAKESEERKKGASGSWKIFFIIVGLLALWKLYEIFFLGGRW